MEPVDECHSFNENKAPIEDPLLYIRPPETVELAPECPPVVTIHPSVVDDLKSQIDELKQMLEQLTHVSNTRFDKVATIMKTVLP